MTGIEPAALELPDRRAQGWEGREKSETTNNPTEPLKVGTWVKIRNSGFGPSLIVEYRGPLGPGGARVYRVRCRKKPIPGYTEVREDQLEVLPDGG